MKGYNPILMLLAVPVALALFGLTGCILYVLAVTR